VADQLLLMTRTREEEKVTKSLGLPVCDREIDRQTDRLMDGQTSCDSIVRAMHGIAIYSCN